MKIDRGLKRSVNVSIHELLEVLRQAMQAEALQAAERGTFEAGLWRPTWWPAEMVAATGAAVPADEEDFLP